MMYLASIIFKESKQSLPNTCWLFRLVLCIFFTTLFKYFVDSIFYSYFILCFFITTHNHLKSNFFFFFLELSVQCVRGGLIGVRIKNHFLYWKIILVSTVCTAYIVQLGFEPHFFCSTNSLATDLFCSTRPTILSSQFSTIKIRTSPLSSQFSTKINKQILSLSLGLQHSYLFLSLQVRSLSIWFSFI